MQHRHLVYAFAPGVVVGLVVGVVLAVLTSWWIGLLVAIALAVAIGWFLSRRAAATLISHLGALPLGSEGTDERLRNVIDGICLANGIAEPTPWRLDDAARNAVVLAAHDGSVHLVVTDGLLDACDVMMLEGVVAQQLSVASQLDLRAITVASHLATFGPLAGLRPRLIDPLLPEQFRAGADVRGVEMTRYPPGLVAALQLADGAEVAVRGAEMLEPVWLFATGSTASAAGDRTDDRIAVLREL